MDSSKKDETVEFYEARTEPLGVDSADFILEDATYIKVQVLIRGKIKVIPQDLVEGIAKLIREYELKKAGV